jgi:hypothetical protein
MHNPSLNISDQKMAEPNTLEVILPHEAAENSAIHRGRAYPIMHGSTRGGRRHRSIPMTELERLLLWILVFYEGLKVLVKIFSLAL